MGTYFCSSKQRHRGSSGYIEVYSGDGGLDLDSFLNVKDWHRYDDCRISRIGLPFQNNLGRDCF